MRKRETNIKQHYVPQFYLKNFTNSNGKINVYDTIRDNRYVTSPAKECYEKYFYDIDLDIFKKFVHSDQNYEELVDDKIRTLNEEVSAILMDFLSKVRHHENCFNFPSNQRDKLYNFIILQIIRTPYYRKRLSYLNVPFSIKTGLSGELGDEKTLDVIHNLLIYGVISSIYGKDFGLNEPFYHIFEHIIEETFNLKRQLEKAGKLFLVNKSDNKFICSSSPVNLLWKYNPLSQSKALVSLMNADSKLFDIGDYIEFQTIHLPISSDVAIFLFDKNYSYPLTLMNQGIGRIYNWNSDIIKNLNLSTMLKSYDKVFSANNNFDELIEMKNAKINPVFNFRFNEKK